MDYSGEGVSVYAEAKGEYTRQLCQYLAPSLQKYFLDLFDLAKEREKDPKKHLVSFQTLLEAISEWNVDKVQRETQSIAIGTQCDYLEELLTAVFIAHTKVLSAIRLTNRQKKLQITIPKLEHFLHRTLTECARLLWTNTFLFATTGTALDRQKNMRQIEGLITEGILQGVRTMLPVKSILREYLTTESDTEAEDEEEEELPADEDIPAIAAPEPPPAPAPVEVGPTGPAEPIIEEEPGPTGSQDVSGAVLDLSGATVEEDAASTIDLDGLEEVDPPEEAAAPADPDTKSIPLGDAAAAAASKKPKAIVTVQKSKTPPASPKPAPAVPPSPKLVPTINLDEERPRVSFSEENTVFESVQSTMAPSSKLAADLEAAVMEEAELSMDDDAEAIEEAPAEAEEPAQKEDDLGIDFEELA